MHIEILDEPFHVTLFGYGDTIGSDGIPATGKRLMDKMWREIRDHGIKSKGIDYWVYLPNSTIFTGVELIEPTAASGALDKLDVSLDRYLRHVHTGDYATLPQIWPQLIESLKEQKEIPRYPNLEIYGHWNPDPDKCETTILIGVK